MLIMENSEEVLQILERYAKLKPKDIPKELEDYLCYVAKTGDTVYRWTNVKHLFREKLMRVIKDFHESTPSIEDLPQYPNVDPFNYESMKSALLERLEMFSAAPFTVQRLCELLTDPRKQYSRIDKYMRALEKNILVVSTIEPGRKPVDSENGDSLDSVVNGDLSLDVNVEVDMEGEHLFNIETANTSTESKAQTSESSSEIDSAVTEDSKVENSEDDEKKMETANERLDVDILSSSSSSSDSDSNKEKSEPVEKQPKLEKDEVVEKDVEENSSATEKDVNEDKLDERLAEETKIEDKSHEEKDKNYIDDTKDSTHSIVREEDKTNNSENEKEEDKNEIKENGEETESWKDTTKSIESDFPPSNDEEEKKLTETHENSDDTPPEDDKTIHSKPTDEPVQSEISPEEEPREFEVEPTSEKPIEEPIPDDDSDFKAKKVQEQMAIEELSVPLTVEEPTCTALLQPMADTITPPVIPDQPMDDNLENTPQIPTSSCLNEVVMQSETEMATDSDAVKTTEAAGMDIDDTSQEEAMDQ